MGHLETCVQAKPVLWAIAGNIRKAFQHRPQRREHQNNLGHFASEEKAAGQTDGRGETGSQLLFL